jgi:hypothetical protein
VNVSFGFFRSHNCKFRKIRKWFDDNSRIRNLIFDDNDIEEIEDGAFTPLITLETLSVVNNRLRSISARAFPSFMPKFREFYLGGNQITSIDVRFFTAAVELIYIDLRSGFCLNLEISNFKSNREAILASFGVCFNNFEIEMKSTTTTTTTTEAAVIVTTTEELQTTTEELQTTTEELQTTTDDFQITTPEEIETTTDDSVEIITDPAIVEKCFSGNIDDYVCNLESELFFMRNANRALHTDIQSLWMENLKLNSQIEMMRAQIGAIMDEIHS